jgi:hypothetical protein
VVDWDAALVLRRNVLVSIYLQFYDTLLTRPRYVAMHAMQEDSSHDHSTSNGYAEGSSSQRKQSRPQMRDTLAAVGGMLIPLLTQIGHHH